MKTNRKSCNKGWHTFFLVVILVFQVYFPQNVFAQEESLNEITENKINEEVDNLTEELNEVIFSSKEDIWNHYSNNMEFTSNKVIIQSKINQQIIVEDILNNILIEELKIENIIYEIYIIDTLGNIMNNTDIITNENYIVFFGEDYINQYKIELFGDYTSDGVINENDVNQAIENNTLTPEEVSYLDYVVNNNTYQVPATDTEVIPEPLENNLQLNKQDVYIEEQITVMYSISGLELNNIDTISGKINYNKDALELIDIYISENNLKKGKVQDQYFIYLLEEIQTEKPLLILLFKTKQAGNQTISITDLKAVNKGILLNLNNNVHIDFLVQNYGTGGDGDYKESSPQIQDTKPTSSRPVTLVNKISTNKATNKKESSQIITTQISLNNDNYIEKLSIEGYEIKFNKNQTEYQLYIENNINELNLNIELSNPNSTYFITGNNNLKPGKNSIILTVQAEDGSTKNYTIDVNKKTSNNKKESIKNDKTKLQKTISSTVLIILILSIIWCLYLFIKKED